ncbi:lactonase family protein [Cyclobacterium lianum]|nr:lactonase family protein [Cyclobacterium lianum]
MKINNLIPAIVMVAACGQSTDHSAEKSLDEMSQTYSFLLGTYTSTPEQGIHLLEFKPENGGFNLIATASEPDNPSFVVSNKDQNLVFSVEETGGDGGGKVSSFALTDEGLTYINSVSAEGDAPCYLSMDPSERYIVAANYSSGNFSLIPIGNDGRLHAAVQVVSHQGSSVHPNRQKQPHAHAALFHPEDSRLLVADLGTDEVVVYDFNPDEEKPLNTEASFRLKVKPGAGPRHMVFDEAGEILYLIHEITAEIGVYRYEDGVLEHLKTYSLLSEGFSGSVGAAEIRLSPDQKFLYASNRGEANEIIVFQIDAQGKLKHTQTIESGGLAPRNFNITPDGKYLITGNQNSNNLLVFSRNPKTGTLSPTEYRFEMHKPVYINFLP